LYSSHICVVIESNGVVQDIPGCGKFKKKPLQCEEQLREMFGPFTVDGINDVPNEKDHEDIIHDWAYQEEEEEDVQEVTPTSENAKKRLRVVLKIPKKAKSSTTLIIQEMISTIAESSASFTSRKEAEVSIKEVMQHVLHCYTIVCKKRSKGNVFNPSN
jgi:hypothetical protein